MTVKERTCQEIVGKERANASFLFVLYIACYEKVWTRVEVGFLTSSDMELR